MTLLSMTGYGSARGERNGLTISVEVRSVNHRFLDVSFRLPSVYFCYESSLQKIISDKLTRGHVDVFVTRQAEQEGGQKLLFNSGLFQEYLNVVDTAIAQAGVVIPEAKLQAVVQLLQRREIIEVVSPESIGEEEYGLLKEIINSALNNLIEMRTHEGDNLAQALRLQLSEFQRIIGQIGELADTLPETFHARLKSKLQRMKIDTEIDESRLAQEVAILAERTDITEELERLRSHIEQFKNFIADNAGGRKFDFLVQEMGREINTIGSKVQNSQISGLVIEAKAVLEKAREQVQNVE